MTQGKKTITEKLKGGAEELLQNVTPIAKKTNKNLHDYKIMSMVLTLGIMLILSYVLCFLSLVIKQLVNPYRQFLSMNPLKVYFGTLFDSPTIFILIMLVSAATGIYMGSKFKKMATSVDKRKIERSSRDTYGSADFLNYDEEIMKKTFDITTPDYPTGTPLGKTLNQLLCMPRDPKHDQYTNENMVVIGGSGRGKNFAGIDPIVLQRIALGESYLVSDTKGDIYRATAHIARERGFKVLMLNTKNFLVSDGWDALRDIREVPEETAHDLIDIYVSTIMENTRQGSGKGDKFWEDNESGYLRTLLHLVARSKNYNGDKTIVGLYDLVANKSTKELDGLVGGLPPIDTTHAAYANIKNMTSDDLKDKFRSGLATRLQKFATPNVASVLSSDDIRFEEMIYGKYAIYLVTDDSNSAYNFINSLFTSCFYYKLQSMADSLAFKSKLPTKVYAILDEFANASPIPDFSKKISTNRSKNIIFIFSIQAKAQLNKIYPDEEDTILGQCGVLLFFGANDAPTNKYISEETGSMTILSTTEMVEVPTLMEKAFFPLSKRVSKSDQKRYLLDETEVSALSKSGDKRCLIFVRGKGVVMADCYGRIEHPLWKLYKEEEPNSHVPRWVKEKYGEDYVQTSRYEFDPEKILVNDTPVFISAKEEMEINAKKDKNNSFYASPSAGDYKKATEENNNLMSAKTGASRLAMMSKNSQQKDESSVKTTYDYNPFTEEHDTNEFNDNFKTEADPNNSFTNDSDTSKKKTKEEKSPSTKTGRTIKTVSSVDALFGNEGLSEENPYDKNSCGQNSKKEEKTSSPDGHNTGPNNSCGEKNMDVNKDLRQEDDCGPLDKSCGQNFEDENAEKEEKKTAKGGQSKKNKRNNTSETDPASPAATGKDKNSVAKIPEDKKTEKRTKESENSGKDFSPQKNDKKVESEYPVARDAAPKRDENSVGKKQINGTDELKREDFSPHDNEDYKGTTRLVEQGQEEEVKPLIQPELNPFDYEYDDDEYL